MPTVLVVDWRQVLQHFRFDLGVVSVRLIADPFVLEAAKHWIHLRVVPAIDAPALALLDPEPLQRSDEGRTGIGTALIGVEQQPRSALVGLPRLLQRPSHQYAVDLRRADSPDDPPAHRDRRAPPAMLRRQIGYVTRAHLVGCRRTKRSRQRVQGNRGHLVGRTIAMAAPGVTPHSGLTHQGTSWVAAHQRTRAGQLTRHPATPVAALGLLWI